MDDNNRAAENAAVQDMNMASGAAPDRASGAQESPDKAPDAGVDRTAGAGADKIHIADEVIVSIVALALGKTQAATLSNAGGGEGIAALLGKKNPTRGIRIETGGGNVSVDISLTVDYGKKIGDVAETIQNTIRTDVEYMTGMKVTQVNIHVLGLNVRDTPAAPVASAASGGGANPSGGAANSPANGGNQSGGAENPSADVVNPPTNGANPPVSGVTAGCH